MFYHIEILQVLQNTNCDEKLLNLVLFNTYAIDMKNNNDFKIDIDILNQAYQICKYKKENDNLAEIILQYGNDTDQNIDTTYKEQDNN